LHTSVYYIDIRNRTMKNWLKLVVVGSCVAALSACGPMWACGDDCDEEEEEDVVYIEVDKKGPHGEREHIEIEERIERMEDADGDKG